MKDEKEGEGSKTVLLQAAYTMEQIAGMLEINPKTLRSRLKKAKDRGYLTIKKSGYLIGKGQVQLIIEAFHNGII